MPGPAYVHLRAPILLRERGGRGSLSGAITSGAVFFLFFFCLLFCFTTGVEGLVSPPYTWWCGNVGRGEAGVGKRRCRRNAKGTWFFGARQGLFQQDEWVSRKVEEEKSNISNGRRCPFYCMRYCAASLMHRPSQTQIVSHPNARVMSS